MNDPETIGVLLMAYGTPDTLENVEPYYTHIRGGRTPSPELVQELRQRYELVGGATPLLEVAEATRRELELGLNQSSERHFRVILGMKHWHPYIEQAVAEMAEEGIRRAVGLVLAPHYSSMSIAGYYKYFDAAQGKLGTNINLIRIESWHLHQPYLDAVARRVRARLDEFPRGEPVAVIFTAHSLPKKILDQNDPYPQQLQETSEALASICGLTPLGTGANLPSVQANRDKADVARPSMAASPVETDVARPSMAPSPPVETDVARPSMAATSLLTWTFSYQSAGRTPEPWLGPNLPDKVRELADAGVKNILVASIGFISDHLEILYDIDYEAQEAAKERGITLKRTEMLNASPEFVDGLAQLVLGAVEQGR